MPAPDRTLRRGLRLIASAYVLVVAVVAGVGFATSSTETILLAAAISLPASVIAIPAYYLSYGLLAQVPGANPSQSTGSVTCDSSGACHGVTSGDPAAWFTCTTEVLGTVALVAAAVLNLVLLRRLIAARRHKPDPTAA